MKAVLKNFRQPPRKVRLVANMIRGKRVAHVRMALAYLDRKAAEPIKKLVESAVANARNLGTKADDLIVKKISVDKGMGLRRMRPRSRGRSAPYRRWMSIITVELGADEQKSKSKAHQRVRPIPNLQPPTSSV